MTSVNLKKLAADSNVLLSAVIGKAALEVLTNPDLEIITTRFNLLEVERYLPRLTAKYGLDLQTLLLQLNMLPVRVFEAAAYRRQMARAARFLKDRDPDDVHLAALAFKEGACIWSNDRDMETVPIPAYSTARLLKLIHSNWQ